MKNTAQTKLDQILSNSPPGGRYQGAAGKSRYRYGVHAMSKYHKWLTGSFSNPELARTCPRLGLHVYNTIEGGLNTFRKRSQNARLHWNLQDMRLLTSDFDLP